MTGVASFIPITTALSEEGTKVVFGFSRNDWQEYPAERVVISDKKIQVFSDAGSKVLSERYVSRERGENGWWVFTGPEKTFHVKIRGGT